MAQPRYTLWEIHYELPEIYRFFLSATLAWAGLTASAAAAVVGTSEALALERPGVQLAAVQAGLAPQRSAAGDGATGRGPCRGAVAGGGPG